MQASIAATPFRPESEGLLAMSSRDSYYESDEWQEWSDRIHVLAERYDVDLIEGTPAERDAAGLWMGEQEPSGAYTAVGTREQVQTWASHVAAQYDQDSVMVLYADPQGADSLYTFTPPAGADVEGVKAAMVEAGIPGGRVVDGRLEVVSTEADPVPPAALDLIAKRLECGPGQVGRAPVTAVFVEKDEARTGHQPIKEIQAIRQRHAKAHGLPVRGRCPHLTDADDIAASMAYEQGEHSPTDPKVARSYRTLRRHITEQHDALTAAGYSFEPWRGESEQPYANSGEMLADLRDNKRLYYFRTEVSQDSEGALPPDHPMAKEVTVRDGDGHERVMVANDVFRAVHDTIAHSEGHQFGPHGEKMAWHAHRSSLPREAHLALWNETRAQNVFTNAGPHLRVDDGQGGLRLRQKGEEGYLGLTERPYAEQKCVRVPDAFT